MKLRLQQSALLGGRACPDVAFFREFEEICVAPFYFQKLVYISGNSARVFGVFGVVG